MPIASPRVVATPGFVWSCKGNECFAKSAVPSPTVAACVALATRAGRIIGFGNEVKSLGRAALAQCSKRALAGKLPAAPEAVPTQSAIGEAVSQALARQRSLAFAAFRSKVRRLEETLHRRDPDFNERLRRSWHGSDCGDHREDVHPGAPELCDHADNDCDGTIDEGVTLPRYLDADGDAHGDPTTRMEVCPDDISRAASSAKASGTGGGWLVETGNDCDDMDPKRWRKC